MTTECIPSQLEFHALGRREVVGRFDGGRITSDGGGLLLREVDQRIGLLHRLAGCFDDYRNPNSPKRDIRQMLFEQQKAALKASFNYGEATWFGQRIASHRISMIATIWKQTITL